MSKNCKNCGAQVPNESNFCVNCGGNDFAVETLQQGYAPAPQQTVYQPAPAAPKKGGNKTLIIAIIAVLVVALVGVGIFALPSLLDKEDTEQTDDEDKDDEKEETTTTAEVAVTTSSVATTESSTAPPVTVPQTPSVAYSKGSFDGTVYVNEWADLKLSVSSGLSYRQDMVGIASPYGEILFAMSDDEAIETMFIAAYDLSGGDMSESDFIDTIFSDSDLEKCTIADTTVGGKTYKMIYEYSEGVGGNFCIKKQDGYFIIIFINTESQASTEAIRNSITTASAELPETNTYTPSSAYTKGTFDGTTYVNEWANLKLTVPEGFVEADESKYSSYENSSTECGVYFITPDTTSAITVAFEKLPSGTSYTEDEYLDVFSSAVLSNAGYSQIGSYQTVTVAGASYKKASYTYEPGYVTVYQDVCVRNLNGYMVIIVITSVNESDNSALLSQVSTAY